MEQIYHNYKLWEDHKNGFYKNISHKDKKKLSKKVINFFNCEKTVKKYMNKVIQEWVYSCEQNLSNQSMNRIAYLGQAAVCIYAGIPNLITMHAWKFIDIEKRDRADKIAYKIILKWEWTQRQKLKNISKSGKKEDMKPGYQMMLQLNWKKED